MNFIKDNWAETIAMIGGIMTAFFGLIIMFIEHNRLTPNKKTFGLLLLIAAGLTSFGTYFSTTDNNEKTKKLILANSTIENLSRLNNSLSSSNSLKLDTSLNQLDHIIGESESVLANLKKESQKINDIYILNEKIQNNQIGGDTYPIFSFRPSLTQPYTMEVIIFLSAPIKNNDNIFPLRNFSFQISDRFIMNSVLQKKEIPSNQAIVLSIRNPVLLKKNLSHVVGDIQYQSEKDSLNYVISSSAENGNFVQFIVLVKKESFWSYATMVQNHTYVKNEPGIKVITLYKIAERGFPTSIENVKFY